MNDEQEIAILMDLTGAWFALLRAADKYHGATPEVYEVQRHTLNLLRKHAAMVPGITITLQGKLYYFNVLIEAEDI